MGDRARGLLVSRYTALITACFTVADTLSVLMAMPGVPLPTTWPVRELIDGEKTALRASPIHMAACTLPLHSGTASSE